MLSGGTEPDGYLSKIETIDYLQNYAKHFDAPVRTGIEIKNLERVADRYLLTASSDERLQARCVVVATGAFGVPKIPDYSTSLSGSISQIHSADYKNPSSLAEGGVLVVGSGQSGAQIAEELYEAG